MHISPDGGRRLTMEMYVSLSFHKLCLKMLLLFFPHQTSNISHTLVGNRIVDHSDVAGTLPVCAAPTASSFLTWHLASMDCTKTTARRDKIHLSLGIWHTFYYRFDSICCMVHVFSVRMYSFSFLSHPIWLSNTLRFCLSFQWLCTKLQYFHC